MKLRNEIRAMADLNAGDIFSLTAPVALDLAAAAGDPAKLPTFKMIAYTGGLMQLADWYTPVVVDLKGMRIPGDQRPVRRGHDSMQLVGHTTKVDIIGSTLSAEGVISFDNAAAREVVSAAKNGFAWQASIGARCDVTEFVKAGVTINVNGRDFSGPIQVARKSTLGEISFVDLGADEKTSVTVAAQRKDTNMQFSDWLKAKGFDPATISDEQKKFLQASYDAEIKAAQPPAPPGAPAPVQGAPGNVTLDEIVARQKAEDARVTRITEIAAQAITENPARVDDIEKLATAAIQAKQAPESFELGLLRAIRPSVSGHRAEPQERVQAQVLEAAVCMNGSLPKIEAAFTPQVLDEAHRRWPNGLGVHELLLIHARNNGYRGLSVGDVGPVLKLAFRSDLQASGFSTYSLSGILSNVANKFLRDAFNAVESSWREIAAIDTVKDFKQQTVYSLTGALQYDEVGPAGEIPHGTLGEETYTNQARTYGRMLAMTRQDIINDDLGALTRISRRLGRGGALKINDVVWTAFINNSTFFTAARGNYDDGADTVLGIGGLTLAETLFMNQTDPDGKPLGIVPRILLVPNALASLAAQLMVSTEMRDTTANTKFPTSNPHVGKFRVVRSSYLSNASYTGNSALAWFLLADPNDTPVVSIAFLNGKQEPTVESADADFDTLGIQIRGYHDFGATKQEYRGGVKMKGEA